MVRPKCFFFFFLLFSFFFFSARQSFKVPWLPWKKPLFFQWRLAIWPAFSFFPFLSFLSLAFPEIKLMKHPNCRTAMIRNEAIQGSDLSFLSPSYLPSFLPFPQMYPERVLKWVWLVIIILLLPHQDWHFWASGTLKCGRHPRCLQPTSANVKALPLSHLTWFSTGQHPIAAFRKCRCHSPFLWTPGTALSWLICSMLCSLRSWFWCQSCLKDHFWNPSAPMLCTFFSFIKSASSAPEAGPGRWATWVHKSQCLFYVIFFYL